MCPHAWIMLRFNGVDTGSSLQSPNTHFLISSLTADIRVPRSLNDCAVSTFALLTSHLLHIWSTRLHKHPLHWKQSDYQPHLFMFHPIIPIRGEKGLQPLPAYFAHKEKAHPELFHHCTNTDRPAASHVPQLGTCWFDTLFLAEGGLEPLWMRPGSDPVSPLDITRLNHGTHCPTPDTSDLCHLIHDASEWQRGKGAGWKLAWCQRFSGPSVQAVGTKALTTASR